MRDVGHRAVRILIEAVGNAIDDLELLQFRHVLSPKRIAGFLDKIDHRRRDAKLEIIHSLQQPLEVGEVFGPKSIHQLL